MLEAVMTLSEIIEALEAKVLLNPVGNDLAVDRACACDLMSDVLTSATPGAILLTGLTTSQTVYTAEMADIHVICYVRGKKPQGETLNLAKEKGVVLLSTDLPMYESCGRLYLRGLKGCGER